MRQTLYARKLKRGFDVFLAAWAVLALAPLLGAVACAIVAEDGFPVFFRQSRIGQDDRRFMFLKFRSMAEGTSEMPSADATTLQVTRVGRVIRRLSIDELPQLFNILRGEMSVVGPRPAIPAQEELCELRRQSGAIHCRPGLTGLAQVNSYDGMPEGEKGAWDAKYAREVSVLLDGAIILRTIGYLFRRPPTY